MKQEQKITISMDVEDLMSGFAYKLAIPSFKAYKVYRNTFDKRKEELKRPGVYLLECGRAGNECDESQQSAKLHIYIGQSGNVYKRLQSHHSNSPSGFKKAGLEWTSALCFLNDDLSENTLKDLEKGLFKLFKDELSPYFCVHTEKVASKEIRDDKSLEKAIGEIRMYLVVMGIDTYVKSNVDGKSYFCRLPNLDKEARGYRTAERFIVKKDSYVSLEKKTNFRPESYWRLRQELENRGVIKNVRFVCDYEFRSASEAAAVVRGCSSNGQDEWRIRVDGKEMKMKDLLNQ